MQAFIDDMIETMKVENGVGIAAPQVGTNKRVIIVDAGDGPTPFINPKIVSRSRQKIESEEGCLSVPGLRGLVSRPQKIKVEYLNRSGDQKILNAEGFLATVFQHEYDHLIGKLYTDSMPDITKFAYIEEFEQFWMEPNSSEEPDENESPPF